MVIIQIGLIIDPFLCLLFKSVSIINELPAFGPRPRGRSRLSSKLEIGNWPFLWRHTEKSDRRTWPGLMSHQGRGGEGGVGGLWWGSLDLGDTSFWPERPGGQLGTPPVKELWSGSHLRLGHCTRLPVGQVRDEKRNKKSCHVTKRHVLWVISVIRVK